MNRLMENKWSWVEGSHAMRDGVLDSLSDADLAFSPGGKAMTVGALLREMGEVEHSYAESFKHFTQDFDLRHPDAGIASSVAQLRSWFATLDTGLKDTLSAMSDADLDKTIARPGGFEVPVEMQVDIYLQALLIFLGKASIYIRAMNRSLPSALEAWIG